MPKYDYKCPACGHLYSEFRDSEDPQFKTTCNDCKAADYVEVTN